MPGDEAPQASTARLGPGSKDGGPRDRIRAPREIVSRRRRHLSKMATWVQRARRRPFRCVASVAGVLSLMGPVAGARTTPSSAHASTAPAQTSPTRDSGPASTAAAALRRYLEAVEREDIATVSDAWSSTAVDRDAVLRGLRSTWLALDYRFQDVHVREVSVSDTSARLRATARRLETGLSSDPRDVSWSRVFDLVWVEGTWRITSERTATEVLAESIVAAQSADARARLLRESRDLVGAELGEAMMRVADREHIERRLETALSGYSAVRELAADIGEPSLEAAALQNLGNIHYVQQAFDIALEMYERRLELEDARHNTRGAVVALQAIASAHYAASRYDLAQLAYERLVGLERSVGTRASVATTLANLGNVYYLQGAFDFALGAYREALVLQVQLANDEERGRLEFGIGRTLTALGAFEPALAAHREALARRERLQSRAEQGASLQEIGRVLFLQGALKASLDTYDRAAVLETALDNAAGLGRIHLSQGLVLSTQGRFGEALAAYRASIAAFERARETANTGFGWLGAASVSLEMGHTSEALVGYRKSAAIFAEQHDDVGLSRALVGMSLAHLEQHDLQEAMDVALRATTLAERAGALESWWQAEYQRGRALWLLGRPADAKAAYESAATLVDASRDESASRNEEGRTPADRVAPFTALVEFHTHAGGAIQAFVAAEEQKQRIVQEVLHEHRWRVAGDLSADEIAEERLLSGRLVTTSQLRRRARSRVPPVASVVEALDERRTSDRAALAALGDRLAARPAWRSGRARRAVTADSLVGLARPHRALVEFVVGDLETYVLVLGGAEASAPIARAHAIRVSRRDLVARIHAFEAAIRQRTDGGDEGRELFDLLFGQLQGVLDTVSEIVIVPDGPLWRLSFAALPTPDGRPLLERADLSLAVALLQSPQPVVETSALGPAPDHDPAASSPSAAAPFVEPTTSGEPFAGSLALNGRVTVNDVSPFHGRLSADAARAVALAAGAVGLEREADGSAELRALLAVQGLPRSSVVEVLEMPAEVNDGEGLLGAIWALGAAGARTVVARRCVPETCDDRRAIEALSTVWATAPSAASAVRSASRALRSGDMPPPAHTWASLVAVGSVE